MASVRPDPSTPRRKRHPDWSVKKILRDLNQEYNLGLDLRDTSTLTPSARQERAKYDENFRRWSLIDAGVRFLLFKDANAWQNALHGFRYEARAVSQNWIRKPLGDPDTLPSSAEIRKATRVGEQLQLQEKLLEFIDEAKQMLLAGSGPVSVIQSDRDSPAVHTRSTRSRPKRPSTDNELVIELGTAKRVRSQARQQSNILPVSCSIDKVPIRQKVSFAQQHAPTLSSRTLGQSFYNQSANTSKSSFQPSIFSADNNGFPASQQTQTTVDSGSQQPQKESRRPAPPSSVDFFAPSPGDLLALDESFSRYEAMEDEVPTSPDDVPDKDPRPWGNNEPEPELPTNATTLTNYTLRGRDDMEHATSPTLSTEYSSFSGLLDVQMPDIAPVPQPTVSDPLESRLKGIWPTFPPWLREAPICVIWEFTRICLHCGVDIEGLDMNYDPSWAQSCHNLWAGLRKHPAFASRAFPEPPTERAWEAATQGFRLNNDAVVLSGSIDFNPFKEGPLVRFRMNALRLEKGCRLNRRFGADRFLDILMPQLHGKDNPDILKKHVDCFIHWLTEKHSILGRKWSAFYTMDGGKWKPVKDLWIGKEPTSIFKERLHFFAEFGDNFTKSESSDALPVKSAADMLDWLLQFERNKKQPYLKLFSRIGLGLSKTDPTIALEKTQIIDHENDILSPDGIVMNDGIGRMSLGVARKVQEALDLSEMPSAIQARLGPAKGMWIVDVTGHRPDGTSHGQDEVWIETYPSQRKWKCDQLDPYQRTLEINGRSHELKSASLNLQFLPILEDRAKDRRRMRDTIGQRMIDDLHEELETQRASMNRPIEFRQWILAHAGSSGRAARVEHGKVPFVGGLPKENEEIINFLLDGGFDPKKLKFLQELAWDIVQAKCERLKTKLNIRIGRSAYIYMIIDFWGVLEEGEVHLGFSNKFQDEQSKFSDVLLHGIDVLVARSPAHLVSDIQKVKAVFKHELRHLKDVIVFSAKGNVPLADKLSGGDYDGDKAWVCWDSEIVDNFRNAEVAKPPELSRFLEKDKTTFGDLALVQKPGKEAAAIGQMIEGSFRFNMGQSLLGICTNYKERLCYSRNTVNDKASLALSTLLSNLVDQPKQGIKFDKPAWDGLRKFLKIPVFLPDPAYKGDNWSGPAGVEPGHIIDYMKFTIVKQTIDRELTAFYNSIAGTSAENWDPDLAKYYDYFEEICESSRSSKEMFKDLKNRLGEVDAFWVEKMTKDKENGLTDFSARVTEVHAKWRAIKPTLRNEGVKSKVIGLLMQPYLSNDELGHDLSTWSLLKASTMYKLYYKKRSKMVWRICGRQLQFIKAMTSSGAGAPTLVTPLMYAGLTTDKKFVSQYVAMEEHGSTDYFGDDDEEVFGGNE